MRGVPLFVIAALLLLAVLAASIAGGGRVRHDDPRRYRPRQRHRKAGSAFADPPFGADAHDEFRDPHADADPVHAPSEDDAPTDFFTGAALARDAEIVRCIDCRALYHAQTVEMLVEHNAGRCASCGGTALRPLGRARRPPPGPARDRALVPLPLTAEAYRASIGRLVAVSGTVVRSLPRRSAVWPALLMHDATGTPLRLVFVGDSARGLRGWSFAFGLIGSHLRVQGLLQHDEAHGLRLLVTDPAMVREIDP